MLPLLAAPSFAATIGSYSLLPNGVGIYDDNGNLIDQRPIYTRLAGGGVSNTVFVDQAAFANAVATTLTGAKYDIVPETFNALNSVTIFLSRIILFACSTTLVYSPDTHTLAIELFSPDCDVNAYRGSPYSSFLPDVLGTA